MKTFRNSLFVLSLLMVTLLFASCGSQPAPEEAEQQETIIVVDPSAPQNEPSTAPENTSTGIDYLVLVNKEHSLPEGWEDKLDLVHFTNSQGYDVSAERTAYEAYLALKDTLANEEGLFIDVDTAYRSIADQEAITARLLETNGEEYVATFVAKPGYSEHHTGLALDLYMIVDGMVMYSNEEVYPDWIDEWDRLSTRLAEHGFILRYPRGKEDITGYDHEAWHIRYVGKDVAQEIMGANLTLEEYLEQTSSGS